jgi:outer membrane protein W
MKKLLLTAAIFVSTSASADFTLLSGVDTRNGLNLAAEIGFGPALVGIKGLGNIEQSFTVTPSNSFKGVEKDTSLYGGYRLGNGVAVKAGAVFSSYDIEITNTNLKESESIIRPMIGFGYNFTSGLTMDVHYTAAEKLDIGANKVQLKDSYTFLLGYRF